MVFMDNTFVEIASRSFVKDCMRKMSQYFIQMTQIKAQHNMKTQIWRVFTVLFITFLEISNMIDYVRSCQSASYNAVAHCFLLRLNEPR